ncbi:MAG: hypothetical protein GTN80_09755 [Nitrososphaeria archaeon]|nr:hypothetical protein [Nitrososphaeria archaeon]NIN53394.1 hypothetical protein [Nitrososphaeria archaeon]NIQ33906.1 hypothetical protein [Nitrososphaeria archaeon]
MNFAVCVKWTLEPSGRLKLKGNWVDEDSMTHSMNSYDRHAIEESLRWRESLGGKVTLITLGGEKARDVLLEGLAMGADEGVHIVSRDQVSINPYLKAWAVRSALAHIDLSFDIIFCGAQSIDTTSAQFGPILAEYLGIPHISLVSRVEFTESRKLTAWREIEEGREEAFKLKPPVLLTVQSGINDPRLPTMLNIIKARQKRLETLTFEELTNDGPSWMAEIIQVHEVYQPPSKEPKVITGKAEEMAKEMMTILRDELEVFLH